MNMKSVLLLTMSLVVAIGEPGFADKATDKEKSNDRLKQGLIIGGVVVGGIVSWRLLRRFNERLFEKVLDKAERVARRSRMSSSRVTKVEVTNPPLYRLTAPDGSQHHILGTMHISNLSLDDFSTNSELHSILKQADILMPEFHKGRYTQVLKHGFSLGFREQWRRQHRVPALLSEQLGQKHWEKLTRMIDEKSDLKLSEKPIEEFMAEFEHLTISQAYQRLVSYGSAYATPIEGLTMDRQLIRFGRRHGKELIGLETFKQGSSAMLKALPELVANVDDLKKLIDKGGIDYVADTVTDAVHQYAKGKKVSSLDELIPEGSDKTAFYDIVLDQRNIAWVESGKIQNNCVEGKKCLIFVGFDHLEKGNNTLIKLLQKQGYQIERL